MLNKATFAGGCFWCTEAVFRQVPGVKSVTPGYTGGVTANPAYEQVCSGRTGHAEAVEIEFDDEVVSYENLLRLFFATHDPTTPNRQGHDVGTQYRSAVFWHFPEQEAALARIIDELRPTLPPDVQIVTQSQPAATFYPAETEHHRYYELNPYAPYCRAVIAGKVMKGEQVLAALQLRGLTD